MKRSGVLIILGLGIVGAGCRSAAAGPPAAGTSPPTPHAALDKLDSRVPVPLLPMMADHQKRNMRDHLLAVQEIVQALSRNDLPAVEAAAKRIGYSEEMGMMCNHMGAGAPGFTEQALKFHHTADGIGVAARKGDRKGVMLALGSTLQACTACHAAFKQVVVDDATWSRLSAVSPGGHPAEHH